MKKIIVLFSILALLATAACSEKATVDAPEAKVEQAVLEAFAQMFPSAENVEWTLDEDDSWCASFYVSDEIATKSRGKRHHNAWFDHKGKWKMTEVSQDLAELPEPVQTAFAASEYASWEVKDAASIERNDIILLYLIEAIDRADSVLVDSVLVDSVMVEKLDTVNYIAAKVELYYSETGYLVKEVLKEYAPHINGNKGDGNKGDGNCGSDDRHPGISAEGADSALVAKVNAYIEENYPGAEIKNSYFDRDGATVSLVAAEVEYTLYFNRRGEITKIYQTVDPAALPEAVVKTIEKVYAECDTVSVVSAVKVTKSSSVYYKVTVSYTYTVTEHRGGWGNHGSNHGDADTRTYTKKETLRISEEGRLM